MDQSTSSNLNAADGMVTNSLAVLGVVGLRTTDLMLDNIASCGDCRNAAPGSAPFLCKAGYQTTLYSIKATHCPDFNSHDALPDDPQSDERVGHDRRARATSVSVERRSGGDRRLDPDQWMREDDAPRA